jgi:MOSC domain-containing protein YiiM
MFSGKLLFLFITSAAGQPMQEIDRALAVPGRGLQGDRYFAELGTYSDRPGPDREVTLIEIEALEALKQEAGIDLSPAESRRNLVTRGVPLNHLVGREFQIGSVRLRGIRLCEPCDYLARMTQPGVLPGLIHRGGLRAQVLQEGMLNSGDPILPINRRLNDQ